MSKSKDAMAQLSNKVDELMDRIHFFLAEDLGPVKVGLNLRLITYQSVMSYNLWPIEGRTKFGKKGIYKKNGNSASVVSSNT